MPVPNPYLLEEIDEKATIIPFPAAPKAPSPRRRFFAFWIDFSLLYGLSLGLSQWLSLFLSRLIIEEKWGASLPVDRGTFLLVYQSAQSILWPGLCLLFGALYYIAFLHLWQTTLGQGLMGLRIRQTKHQTASIAFRQSVMRFLASIVSLFSLGLFFALGAYKGQGRCFHDELSGTQVEEA